MFKKLKDKISEEVGQSNISPMQQLSQFASYVSETAQNRRSNLSLASSTLPTSNPTQALATGTGPCEAADSCTSAVDHDGRSEAASTTGARPRVHVKTVGDWLRHPDGHLHCQHGDYDCDESEVASSVASLGTVTKEQLLSSYQRVRAKLSRQRARHAELARTCAALDTECRQAKESARLSGERLRREQEQRSNGQQQQPDKGPAMVDQSCGTDAPLEPTPESEAEASPESARLQEKVSQLEGLLIKCKDSIRLHKTKVSTITTQRDKLTSERDQLTSERDQLASERDHLSTEVERVSSESRAEVDRLSHDKETLTMECEAARAREASLRDSADSSCRQLAELKQQLQLKESQAQRLVLDSAKTQKRISDLEKQVAPSSTVRTEECEKLSTQLEQEQRRSEQEKLALVQELSQCQQKLSQTEEDLSQCQEELSQSQEELSQCRSELEAAVERCNSQQKDPGLLEGTQTVDDVSQQEAAVLRDRVSSLEATVAQLRREAADAAQRCTAAEDEAATLRQKLSEETTTLRQSLAESQSRLSAQSESHQVEITTARDSDAQLREQLQASLTEQAAAEQQLRQLAETNQLQLRDIQSLLDSEKSRGDALSADLEARVARSAEIQTELENQRRRYDGVSADLETAVSEAGALRAELDLARAGRQEEVQTLSSRVSELQSQLARERGLKDSELHGLEERLRRAEMELEAVEAKRDAERSDRQQLQEAAHTAESLKNAAENERRELEVRVEEQQKVNDQLLQKNTELESRNRDMERMTSDLSATLDEERQQKQHIREGLQLFSQQIKSHTLASSPGGPVVPSDDVTAADAPQLLAVLRSCLLEDSAAGELDVGQEEDSVTALAGQVAARLKALQGSLEEERSRREEMERRLQPGTVNGAAPDTIDQDDQLASARAERQLLSYRRQLEQTERRHQREVSELRRLLALRTSAASDDPDPVTELQYLRNILYEYMMGRQQMTLAKVLATVLKFSSEQTASVLEKEQLRHSLLAGTAMESVGSTLSALSPFKWS